MEEGEVQKMEARRRARACKGYALRRYSNPAGNHVIYGALFSLSSTSLPPALEGSGRGQLMSARFVSLTKVLASLFLRIRGSLNAADRIKSRSLSASKSPVLTPPRSDTLATQGKTQQSFGRRCICLGKRPGESSLPPGQLTPARIAVSRMRRPLRILYSSQLWSSIRLPFRSLSGRLHSVAERSLSARRGQTRLIMTLTELDQPCLPTKPRLHGRHGVSDPVMAARS